MCKSCIEQISSDEVIFINPSNEQNDINDNISINTNQTNNSDDQSTASDSIYSTNSKYEFENYLISAVNDDISIEENSDDDNSLFIVDDDFDIPTTCIRS